MKVHEVISAFRQHVVDADLTGLSKTERQRVRFLLRAGSRLADEVERLTAPSHDMDSYLQFYEGLSKQMDANQQRFEDASANLLAYAQARRDQLIRSAPQFEHDHPASGPHGHTPNAKTEDLNVPAFLRRGATKVNGDPSKDTKAPRSARLGAD